MPASHPQHTKIRLDMKKLTVTEHKLDQHLGKRIEQFCLIKKLEKPNTTEDTETCERLPVSLWGIQHSGNGVNLPPQSRAPKKGKN